MSGKKICFVCPWMHIDGGLQRVVSNLANQLAGEYDVSLCVVSVSVEKPYYPLDERIKVAHLPEAAVSKKGAARRFFRKIFNYVEIPCLETQIKWLYYPKKRIQPLEAYLSEYDFDYVIASCGDLSMLLACVSREKVRAKLIGWEHNSFNAYFEKKGNYYYGRKALAGKLFRNLDEVVCLTERDCSIYKEQIDISSRFIYNPLSFRCEKKTDPENQKLIFVGRLDWEQKGLGLLVEILERYFSDDRSRDWNVIVVGDGEGRNRFEEEIRRAGFSERVVMAGKTDRVQQYFLQSSICLNTSKWEGFGLVITEAMECGLPVVAFATDGPREIITEGKDGYIISGFDTDLYAEKLLELSADSGLRREMAGNASAKADAFSADKILLQWKRILN